MEVLIQYKELISIVIVAIIEIVVLLIAKKRPQIVDSSLLAHLCDWILEAEDKFKVGSDKMQYVLDHAKVYLGEQYVELQIRNLVEHLLTMPEKKGKK